MGVALHIKSQDLLVAMARKQFNCTQLAKASGVSRATISYIKNGKTCKPEVVGKLASALDISVKELIDTNKE